MKKFANTCIALALAAALLAGLTGCTMFRNMREYVKNAGNTEILETPADGELVSVYRAALDNSVAACKEISENTTRRVRDPQVSAGSGTKDTALLNASAKQLAALILQSGPGSEKNAYTAADAENSLLYAVLAGQFTQTVSERDRSVSTLEDGNGNAVTDENGEPVTEEMIASNDLRIFFRMYEETPAAEGEEAAVHKIAEDAAIEAVFGAAKDKAEMLAACEAVKDYLQVTDYTFEYQACFVKAALDMETDLISSVTFEKNVDVTARVTGAGPLADCGDFTVTFRLTEQTDYTFSYPEEE